MDSFTVTIARDVARDARESLSSFCMNECRAKCCKQGKLLLKDDKEIKTICGNKVDKYFKSKILERISYGLATYNLEKKPCKMLYDGVKCRIHKSKLKPVICDDYPLFLTREYVILSNECPGVERGMLDEYKSKLVNLGYKVY